MWKKQERDSKTRLSLFNLLPNMGQYPGSEWAMTLVSSGALSTHIPKLH